MSDNLDKKPTEKRSVTRREFLRSSLVASLGASLSGSALLPSLTNLQPIDSIDNPLAFYPARDWEKVYRDQYKYDDTFTFVCSPNDTHQCRLRAFVRNGILVRIEQNYDAEQVTDLYGNKMTAHWNPRGCLKGFTLCRRLYGPYRVKTPMVRTGWKQWAEAGFPADAETGLPEPKYFHRGEDSWERVSWDEAQTLLAKAVIHLVNKYSGENGAKFLHAQGYPEEMIEATHHAGARTVKCRAGMWTCGMLQLGAVYRFSNMLGLFDGENGGRVWSNYDWHGDLPPGHPMVTGIQTFDPDLDDFRRAKLLVFMGKNMVENKMADAHWWIEAIERGAKVVNISPEYSPASQKADYWIPIRPGSDVALLLGITNLLIKNKWYDADFVKQFTDMPLLVRMDNLKMLRPSDLGSYQNAPLRGYSVEVQQIDPALREKWGDFAVWDTKTNAPQPVTRDDVGKYFAEKSVDPALEGTFTVKLADGKEIKVKPVFQLYAELCQEYDLDTVHDITHAPKPLIEQLAKDMATIKPVMLHTGEGINHYFHCDITTRAVFLPMALTGNIGKPGGNVGHWAGNYKSALFEGTGAAYIYEDPTAPDQGKTKKMVKAENPCYWNFEDRPLIVGGKCFTGKTHMPTPTKMIWTNNVNLLNNAKWAYDMVANVNPKIEILVYNEVEWTGTCEYADLVFPAQMWPELTQPNFTASCSNPFLQVWKGGIAPLFDNRTDGEIVAGVAAKMTELTGDKRFAEYFKHFLEGHPEVHLQRILDASSATKGYKVEDLLQKDHGVLMQFRTTPRITGWEQIHESKPFYTKTGRMELYREEDEFIQYGENLIVHREPVEATPYLPNVIVATHEAIRPNDFGIPLKSEHPDERAVRNVKMAWEQAKKSKNPLWEKGYRYYCLTPKTRHRVHSSWSVADWNLIWDSNFGDPYRMDKRTPAVGEHQIHLNPEDARALGVEDGDYVYVDANPFDRPYKGWKPEDPFYKVSRLMLRVKYNPAYPPGVTMMKHAPFMATHKSVKGHETRPDGRAVSADTGYQSNLRYGSQQSLTRGWLQPTQMTDSLVRKDIYGQKIGEGYEPDIHSPNTCPKETLVRIIKAEDGRWEPAATGLTPSHENLTMQAYLVGKFISNKNGGSGTV